MRISADRFLQSLETTTRVMKGGDCFVQPCSRKIDQQLLKFTERTGRFPRLPRTLDDVMSPRPLDKQIATPPPAFRVAKIRLSIASRHEGERAARRVLSALLDGFARGVLGHPRDVLHQCRDVFEDPMIDPL
jgi:hypothetical protein